MQIVETFDEHQKRELFDHRQRIGDAARPKSVPDLIDLGADGACEHGDLFVLKNLRQGRGELQCQSCANSSSPPRGIELKEKAITSGCAKLENP